MSGGPRERDLIDALERLVPRPFAGRTWRIVRDGRDPMRFQGGGNRWDDATFEVLYTSLQREGAIAEMRFHIGRGQPVIPSKIRYRLHEIDARLARVLDLTDPDLLSELGVDMSRYGRLPYPDRGQEYDACQRIGEAVHFLGSGATDGPSAMLVPNARISGENLVVIEGRASPGDIKHRRDHGLIDWDGA